MARNQFNGVTRYIKQLAAAPGADRRTDRRLLQQFATDGEPEAFAELLRRHGPMVQGVCWRVLGHAQDAEDAFQATFLVLARRAEALRSYDAVAGWLHEAAARVARKLLTTAARRTARERRVREMTRTEVLDDHDRNETYLILDDELSRLSDKYRLPLVLCYLEGKSNQEAARILGCSRGTVSGRLARARQLLRVRLTRRGMALSTGALAALLLPEALRAGVPAAPLETTLRSAVRAVTGKALAGHVSNRVAGLVEFGLRETARTQLKALFAIVLALGLVGSAAGLVISGAFRHSPQPVVQGPPQTEEPSVRPNEVPPPNKGRTETAPTPPAIAPPTPPVVSPPASAPEPPPALPPKSARGKIPTSWTERTVLKGHPLGAFLLEFAPDGATLASGGNDGMVRLWDVPGGRERAVLRGHRPTPMGIHFAPDGKALTTLGSEGMLKVWDLTTNRETSSTRLGLTEFANVAFTRDGTTMVTTVGTLTPAQGRLANQVQIWDLTQGRKRTTFLPHELDVTTFAIAPDGKTLATAGSAPLRGASSTPDCPDFGSFQIKLWDAAKLKEIAQLPGDMSHPLRFAPDGKSLAAVWRSRDGKSSSIKRFDAATGKELSEYKANGSVVTSLAISPDGRLLAAGNYNRTIQLWDTETGKAVGTLRGHAEFIQYLVFSPDGNTLASAGPDGPIHLWTAEESSGGK